MSSVRRVVQLWLVVVMSLVGSIAAAQDAATLKAEGDRYMDHLDFDKALALYEQAYALSPDPVLLYNSGRALQGLNRYPEALDKLDEFRRDASPELLARVPGIDELIARVQANVATISVKSSVAGARVLVAGKMVGSTPVAALRVNAGSTKIELFKDGYLPASVTVTLTGGEARDIALDLVPSKPSGLITVRSTVAGAAVAVDGRGLGVAPTQTEVAAGEHKVVVTHPDYDAYETTVVVKAGESTRVNAELEPSASVFETWWFWTITGGVVAGAAVTAIAIAATSERDPDTGDIPPGQVSVPIRGASEVWISLPMIRF